MAFVPGVKVTSSTPGTAVRVFTPAANVQEYPSKMVIQALASNTNKVWVGGSTVTNAGAGAFAFSLAAGAIQPIGFANAGSQGLDPTQVYFDVTTTGEGISYWFE